MPDILTVTVPDLPTVSRVTGDELIAVYTGNRLSKMPQAALRGTRLSTGPTMPPLEPSVLVEMAPVIGDRWRNTETGDEWKITSLDPVTWTPDGNVIGPAGSDGDSIGPAGEPGRKGDKGDKGDFVTKVIGATLPDDCVVVVIDDQFYPADFTNATHCGLVVGIVHQGGAAGSLASAQGAGDLAGVVGAFNGMDRLYPAANGTLTSVPPTVEAGATWRQSVATASTSSHIIVLLGDAFRLSPSSEASVLVGPDGGVTYKATPEEVLAGAPDVWVAPSDIIDLIGDRVATTPYLKEGGTVAVPLYLRRTLARIDVEDYCKASDPTTHRTGWQAAVNALVAAGGGSLKAPGASYTFNDVTQPEIVSGSTILQKAFCIYSRSNVDIEIEVHRDTRFVCGPAIRPNSDGSGSIVTKSGSLFGFYLSQGAGANRANRRQFAWVGGRFDISAAAPGATSIDGFTLSGEWDYGLIEGMTVDHGVGAPALLSGGAWSLGGIGGDSSVFVSNVRNLHVKDLRSIGAQDLALYVSGETGELCRIEGISGYRCQGLIGVKRGYRRVMITDPMATECANGIFAGVADGLLFNQGQEFQIRGGFLRRMQGDPIRFQNNTNVLIDGTTIEDYGKYVGDPSVPAQRASTNRPAAIKFDGTSNSSVRNCTIGFAGWDPHTGANPAYGVSLATYQGLPSSNNDFDGNTFYGRNLDAPLYGDYVADEACINNSFDRAPRRTDVHFDTGARRDGARFRSLSYTPALSGTGGTGLAYAERRGTYMRSAETISFAATLYLSAVGTVTGTLTMSGLPVASQGGSTVPTLYPLALDLNDVILPAGCTSASAYILPGTGDVAFAAYNPTTGNKVVLTATALTATSRFVVSGSYPCQRQDIAGLTTPLPMLAAPPRVELPGVTPARADRQFQGIPGVDVVGGRTFGAWYGDHLLTNEGPSNYAVVAYSNDKWVTKTVLCYIVSDDVQTRVGDPGVWTDAAGRVWIFLTIANYDDDEANIYGCYAFVISNPLAANPTPGNVFKLSNFAINTRPVTLANGKVLIGLDIRDRPNSAISPIYTGSTLFYLDTTQRQLTRCGRLPQIANVTTTNSFPEASPVQLPSGELIYVIRTTLGQQISRSPSGNPAGPWSPFTTWGMLGVNALSRARVRLSPRGNLVAVYNATAPSSSAATRANLTLAISTDGGYTIAASIVLEVPPTTSYPDIAFPTGAPYGSDDIVVIYDRNRSTDAEIKQAVVSESALLAGTATVATRLVDRQGP